MKIQVFHRHCFNDYHRVAGRGVERTKPGLTELMRTPSLVHFLARVLVR